jgi:hypothetical protein
MFDVLSLTAYNISDRAMVLRCSEVSGNANLVAHRILEKLPQNDRCGHLYVDLLVLFKHCPTVKGF